MRVAATIPNLRTISEFVRDAGRSLGLTEDTLFDIDIAVEEASANIVHHAYAPGQPGDILLRIETADDVVRITLTDWGRPFDAGKVKPFDLNAPIEVRAHGGMGLHLMHSSLDDVVRSSSSATGVPNVLTLSKKMER